MKEWFKARNIWGAAIMTLSDAEAGRLMKALWNYTMTGEQQNLSGAEKGIFALILMTLGQDDARESEISEKRAAAGSIGGKQKVANQANANFATEEIANQANACNKNKNKNIYIQEDEEEDEDNIRRVRDAWMASFGSKPSPAAIKRLLASGLDLDLVEKAIRISAVKSPKSPVDFVLTVLRDWKAEHLTIDDVDEYLMINDAVNGRIAFMTRDDALDELQKFRRRKKVAS